MIDKRIEFDEEYLNEEENLLTLYFTAPVDILDGKYHDAVAAEISVEIYPADCMDAKNATVAISPTKVLEDGSFYDYDWRDTFLLAGEVEELIDIAKNRKKGGNLSE